jgi:small subunit ribosomal protein S20
MPHTKSAAKRHRQSIRRNEDNRARTSAVRTAIRRLDEAVTKGDKAAVQAAVASAFKRIDKAAKASSIHANTAARRKALVARKAAKVK